MTKKTVLFVLLNLCLLVNYSFAQCEQSYVPPTTQDELLKIREWAIVLAFIPMAEKAGYHFDAESYMEDIPNPNPAAFHFGFVTATTCYPVDVITSYYSYSVVLMRLYHQDIENFKIFYTEHADRYGYTPYLTPLNSASIELASF